MIRRAGIGTRIFASVLVLTSLLSCSGDSSGGAADSSGFAVIDTGQENCYNDMGAVISCPGEGENFAGQDAQYVGASMSYRDNGDGTISDLTTGLMWQKSDDGVTRNWREALAYCESLELGGHSDWRLPNAYFAHGKPMYSNRIRTQTQTREGRKGRKKTRNVIERHVVIR